MKNRRHNIERRSSYIRHMVMVAIGFTLLFGVLLVAVNVVTVFVTWNSLSRIDRLENKVHFMENPGKF